MARLIREAHERVKQTLGERRDILEALARLLLEKEVLDRPARLGSAPDNLGHAVPAAG